MIRYVDGDLLKLADENNFDVIAHGCNCFCVMGAGIAPQIKAKYPEAYAVDCETTAGDVKKLGTITHTKNTTPIVVNIYSQYDTKGRRQGKMDLDYDALRSGIKAMKEKFSGKRFGLPQIGAGLAGGDWTIIEKIIEEEMRGEYVTIVNYVP
jgi:O-acetyl-ADP-ribose deacetylase (regulator of RNase III)